MVFNDFFSFEFAIDQIIRDNTSGIINLLILQRAFFKSYLYNSLDRANYRASQRDIILEYY